MDYRKCIQYIGYFSELPDFQGCQARFLSIYKTVRCQLLLNMIRLQKSKNDSLYGNVGYSWIDDRHGISVPNNLYSTVKNGRGLSAKTMRHMVLAGSCSDIPNQIYVDISTHKASGLEFLKLTMAHEMLHYLDFGSEADVRRYENEYYLQIKHIIHEIAQALLDMISLSDTYIDYHIGQFFSANPDVAGDVGSMYEHIKNITKYDMSTPLTITDAVGTGDFTFPWF